MLSLNKSYNNRKVSLTIHCKYKYFDSTIQRAEDRQQKFYFCRFPFAVNVKLNLSIIFSRLIKDGSHRTILNLKQFNELVEYHHFKMDMLETAIDMMKPSCYMASVDPKDVYYMVPIDSTKNI